MPASRHRRRPILVLLLTALAVALGAAPASASGTQESMFQDDSLLVFGTPDAVAQRLDTLRFLGVDRIRVTVFWNQVAPDPNSRSRPSFDAANPGAYPRANWDRYDNLVVLARQRDLGVNFNIAAPAPAWAEAGTGNSNYVGHYRPSAGEYASFVQALGKRYSGAYIPDPVAPGGSGTSTSTTGGVLPLAASRTSSRPRAAVPAGQPLPRVGYWSLWNEPNGVHFLAPPWDSFKGHSFEASAAIYRSLVDAGFGALSATGHGPANGDTILIGETAPMGQAGPGENHSLRPLRFIRALYCVDGRLRTLTGTAAQALGCPSNNFAGAHPALFAATGFAHHPYNLLLPPTFRSPPDSVTTGDLGRLTGTLDGIFRHYGRARRIPVYETEFGYESRPPSPFGVPLARQAQYINQSEYMAYRDRRVRSYSQFLLVDSGSSDLFQTGLEDSAGHHKPAFDAYRAPIFIPSTHNRRGKFRVWGLFRPGRRDGVSSATIQFRTFSAHKFTDLTTVSAGHGRYADRTIRVGSSGVVRLAWHDPVTGITTFSRGVAVFHF